MGVSRPQGFTFVSEPLYSFGIIPAVTLYARVSNDTCIKLVYESIYFHYNLWNRFFCQRWYKSMCCCGCC